MFVVYIKIGKMEWIAVQNDEWIGVGTGNPRDVCMWVSFLCCTLLANSAVGNYIGTILSTAIKPSKHCMA